MNEIIFAGTLMGKAFILTPWKIVGYCGALMFMMRWPVQMLASHRAGKPVVPISFWLMSIAGSLALLSYFIFGKTDSVGIVSNLFPSTIAAYNLYLILRGREARGVAQATGASGAEGGGKGA